MDSLIAYLPQDRLRSLARGEPLPVRTGGAALFADISGFTPLTEALDRALGPRRGVEALSQHINRAYDALVAEVERYGGSVIGFAGDSITCWFDESVVLGPSSVASADTPDMLDKRQGTDDNGQQDESLVRGPLSFASADTPHMLDKRQGTDDNGQRTALRAVGCALALQHAMRQFAAIALPDGTTIALELKVAVASGPARRFVVGDPNIQLIDALAGATIDRMAAGEPLAHKGEILLDEATAAALGDTLSVAEWRMDVETGEHFAVLAELQIADCRLIRWTTNLQSTIYNLQSYGPGCSPPCTSATPLGWAIF